MLTFIESPTFSKVRKRYLNDDEFAQLQASLIEAPEAGAIIRGSGGVRKLRWHRKGTGKSGGLRVIYYYRDAVGQIWLLGLYAKSRQATVQGQQAKRWKDEF